MHRFPSSLPPPSPKLRPCLTFAPLAWLKLQFFGHTADTEIGGFGVSAAHDLLYVEDFVTLPQEVTSVTVRFRDEGVADYFDACLDRGLSPARCGRIWCHTHPGASVTPSGIDEATFARSFGRCDWAVMFILGRTGLTYARLRLTAGPGAELMIPTTVDWAAWPQQLATTPDVLTTVAEQWRQEYAAHVHRAPESLVLVDPRRSEGAEEAPWWEDLPWCPEWDAVRYDLVEEATDHVFHP
jgi:hypothetical protein